MVAVVAALIHQEPVAQAAMATAAAVAAAAVLPSTAQTVEPVALVLMALRGSYSNENRKSRRHCI
jgi:hypothetical protein